MKNKKKTSRIGILIYVGVLVLYMVGATAFSLFNKPNHSKDIDPLADMFISQYSDGPMDPNGDDDQDGLINSEEIRLGTNPKIRDTDKDGISDYDEINSTMTDSKLADTDGDGLNDGVEVAAELNPLEKKSDGKTLDGKIKKEYTYEVSDSCTLDVSGDANAINVYANTCDITGIKQTAGIVGELYEFHMDGNLNSAKLTMDYSDYDLDALGIKEENLAIFQFTDDKKFERVKNSKVDKKKKTVTATLSHFSRYVLADASCVGQEKVPQVFLLIDDSGSMYSKELCESSDENDVEYKRVDFANKFLKMCDKSIEFAAASFTADYMPIGDYSCSRSDLMERIESIKTNEDHNFNGTYIAESGIYAINDMVGNNSFEEVSKKRRFLILITDGVTTESTYSCQDLIDCANYNSVVIFTIGIGNSVDTNYLTKAAEETGGIYCYAANADSLDKIYNRIMSGINYNFIDSNGDNIVDRAIIADSGFKPEVHGIAYENYLFKNDYGSAGGQCYGIAALSYYMYLGKMPLKMEEKEEHKSALLGSKVPYSEAYDLSSSAFFQSDSEYANSKQNLCNYVNKTLSVMKDVYSIETLDRYNLVGDTLQFSNDALALINSCKFLEICVNDNGKDLDYYDNTTYRKNEYLKVNLEGIHPDQLSQEELDDYNFFKAVNRLYSCQGNGNELFETCCEIPCIDYKDESMMNDFFTLVKHLGAGEPVLISAEEHTINAVRLARDLDNPMIYYLTVYDNNSPNEEKELVIEFQKDPKDFLDHFDLTNFFNTYWAYVYDIDGVFTKGIAHEESELGRDVIEKKGASKCMVELDFSVPK